jgi:nitrile hydratase
VSSGRFKVGDHVRVKDDDRPGHLRTPFFLRGKIGWIEERLGECLNPETLAYGKDGMPKRALYKVGFRFRDVWGQSASGTDKVYADIMEHWLDPA